MSGQGFGIGLRIAHRRLELKLTQVELARELKVPASQLSHWETGRRLPNAANLRNICRTLTVSADWILGLDDPNG